MYRIATPDNRVSFSAKTQYAARDQFIAWAERVGWKGMYWLYRRNGMAIEINGEIIKRDALIETGVNLRSA